MGETASGKEKTVICNSISLRSRCEEAQGDENSKENKNAGYFLMKDPQISVCLALVSLPSSLNPEFELPIPLINQVVQSEQLCHT